MLYLTVAVNCEERDMSSLQLHIDYVTVHV